MQFEYIDPDLDKKPLGTPDMIGSPSDRNGEFIICDPQYGERVARQIDFYYIGFSGLRQAVENGDESRLREHIVAQDEPGRFKLVNIVGYAAIRPDKRRTAESEMVLVKVHDFKETQPYKPTNA